METVLRGAVEHKSSVKKSLRFSLILRKKKPPPTPIANAGLSVMLLVFKVLL